MRALQERRSGGRVVALAVALVVAVVVALVPAAVAAGTLDDAPPTTINEFIPTERNLTDCVSALPKPGCGSEARGGWHQTAVFGVMVAGLAVIGARIVIGVRRRPDAPVPREHEQPTR